MLSFYIATSLYTINGLFSLVHKNLDILHYSNRMIVSIYTFIFPMISIFNYYVYKENLLTYYYLILYVQMTYYFVDIIPMILGKNYIQVSHHIIGSLLNYAGYLLRNNKYILYITIIVYFVEQGSVIFHTIMKLCDYTNNRSAVIRKYSKKLHFFLIKSIIFVKMYITYYIFYYTTNIYARLTISLQLLWNLFVLKKILKILFL